MGTDTNWQKSQSPKSHLYSLIVSQKLGSNAALIVSLLIKYNTLTKANLIKLVNLPKRVVDKLLVILIQLNCVVYHFDPLKKQYFYSVNDEGPLKLFFANDIVTLINHYYSHISSTTNPIDAKLPEIVQNVLKSGNLSINDYTSSSSENQSEKDDLIKSFNKLISDRWLIPINDLYFQSKIDKFQFIFNDELYKFNMANRGKVISQSKKILMVRDTTIERFIQLYQPINPSAASATSSTSSINQKYTINFNKFKRYQYYIQLASEVKHRIGLVTSKLYFIVLKIIESKYYFDNKLDYRLINQLIVQVINNSENLIELNRSEFELMDDSLTNFSVSSNDIIKYIEKNKCEELKNDIINTIQSNNSLPNKRIKLEDGSIGEISNMQLNNTIFQHLKLLSNDTKLKFLKDSQGSFVLPLNQLMHAFKIHFFKSCIRNIFGPQYLRILNCIEDKKLIDQKILSKLSLMKDKDINMVVVKLVEFQILEIQEIPKSQDRSASRSVFAFRIATKDYKKPIELFDNCVLFNSSQILESIEMQKASNKILLDKLNRIDVKGNELKFLMKNELIQLKEYKNFEKFNLVKLQRLKLLLNVLYLN